MWSDTESDKDYLNFGEVSELAIDILTSEGMLPVSIGVFGNWGAGKSSLLKLIEQQLKNKKQEWIVVKFDAWLYQGYDDARAALLEIIAKELTKAAEGDDGLKKKTKKLLGRIDKLRVFGLATEGVALLAGIPTWGILSRSINALGDASDGIQDQKEQKNLSKNSEEAKKQAIALVKPEDKKSPPQQIDAFRKEYEEILKELGYPIVVIIDNLDRCLPANAIHTLEAIRLFLFLTNTAFIIAADEEMIRSSVADHFKGASARHQIDYLDKLIQVPIRVPKAGVREIRSYLFMLYAVDHGLSGDKLKLLQDELKKALQQSWKDDPVSRQDALALINESEESELGKAFERADRISPILANSSIIHGNPRIVKRLLNVVKMRSWIARRREMPLDEAIITKLVMFERCAGVEATKDLYSLIDADQGKPKLIQQLEDNSDKLPDGAPNSWDNNPTTKDFILEWSQLKPKLSNLDLRAAIYLSRETMPIGTYATGLSPAGREALTILADTKNISSPAATGCLDTLPLEEQLPVIEEIISQLRQISDWSRKPKGFAGACLLAQRSVDAGKIFKRFIDGLEGGAASKTPWLKTLLKEEQWYKDV